MSPRAGERPQESLSPRGRLQKQTGSDYEVLLLKNVPFIVCMRVRTPWWEDGGQRTVCKCSLSTFIWHLVSNLSPDLLKPSCQLQQSTFSEAPR